MAYKYSKFMFCETARTRPGSRWHIRREGGQTLCGKKVRASMYTGITLFHLERCTCRQCAREFLRQYAEEL